MPREALTEQWKEMQYRFLEDPVYSVREAEHLIVGLMRERGLPHGDFDTRVQALSVAHPELADPYRRANTTSRSAEDGDATIEAMFRAMLQYRMLFEALLERPKREDGVEGSAPPANDEWVSSGAGGSPTSRDSEMTGRGAARKVAVVTGASGGVGRATATALAERGFDVALLARGKAGLDAAALEVQRAGGRAVCCAVDVAEFAQVDAAASRVERELGPIQVWVNDAMTTVFSPFADLDPDDFKRAVEVTFLGQVWGTKAALDRIRERDSGSIVNVGSTLAFIGIPLQTPYCTSKFACRGFFESVRSELLHDGSNVHLSMVHLPAVNTPQFDWCKSNTAERPMPVPPIYQPEIPARFIVDVALDGRRAKVVGSWNKLLVIAGQLSPALANQYAAVGAWDAQLTDERTQPSDAANLMHTCDETDDFGAHGRFDDRAGGFLAPSYLRTLPDTARKFGVALRATLAEKMQRF